MAGVVGSPKGTVTSSSHAPDMRGERSMWRWRDWVIEAFNYNMPFDPFTFEHLFVTDYVD